MNQLLRGLATEYNMPGKPTTVRRTTTGTVFVEKPMPSGLRPLKIESCVTRRGGRLTGAQLCWDPVLNGALQPIMHMVVPVPITYHVRTNV